MTIAHDVVPALTVRGLSQSAQRGGVLHRGPLGSPPLAGLNLSVAPGEVAWVVGASESVAALCRILAGAQPDAGSVAVAGRDVTKRPRRQRAGIARELVVLGPESAPVDAELVAAVAATRPAVIVLDRSAAGAAGPDVLSVLAQVAGELGIGVLVLDRFLPAAAELVGVVHVLSAGRVVEVLGPGDLAHPMHPFVRRLAASGAGERGSTPGESRADPEGHPSEGQQTPAVSGADSEGPPSGADQPELAVGGQVAVGCVWRASCEQARERCEHETPALDRPLGATHAVACHFPVMPPRADEWPFPGGARPEPAEGDRPFSDEPTAQEFAEE